MCIEFLEYSGQEVDLGLTLIKNARLYKPGDGIIGRMTRVRSEYNIDKIIVALDDGKPIACIVCDTKKARAGWSTYSSTLPNVYTRINVWVKPKYRRKGIGKALMNRADIADQIGIECYNTGPASENLYKSLKNSRFF